MNLLRNPMNLLRNPMNLLRIVGPNNTHVLPQRVGTFSSYTDHAIESTRVSENMMMLPPPPKFNSSPLKRYRNPIGKACLALPPFFRVELLNFGGVIPLLSTEIVGVLPLHIGSSLPNFQHHKKTLFDSLHHSGQISSRPTSHEFFFTPISGGRFGREFLDPGYFRLVKY